MIPRIRARVGQATDPPDVAGKWYFEIEVGQLGGGGFESLGLIGPWESEVIAHREMRTACKILCDAYEEKVSGEKSGKYIDMKDNVVKRWDRKDEH